MCTEGGQSQVQISTDGCLHGLAHRASAYKKGQRRKLGLRKQSCCGKRKFAIIKLKPLNQVGCSQQLFGKLQQTLHYAKELKCFLLEADTGDRLTCTHDFSLQSNKECQACIVEIKRILKQSVIDMFILNRDDSCCILCNSTCLCCNM